MLLPFSIHSHEMFQCKFDSVLDLYISGHDLLILHSFSWVNDYRWQTWIVSSLEVGTSEQETRCALRKTGSLG